MYSGPYFMIDIETTGIDPLNNQVLEIGLVEVNRINGLWEPGRIFHVYQHTVFEPKSEFALTHQKELYKKCQTVEPVPTFLVRRAMLDFIQACGVTVGRNVKFMGWNAAIFDLPFLCHYGYFDPPRMETVMGKDVSRGDFDHHVYDVSSVLTFMADSMEMESGDLKKIIRGFKPTIKKTTATEGVHTALHDCYSQIEFLNGLLLFSRKR